MVHDSKTLRLSSIQIVLSIAAVRGFCVISHDFSQVYLQFKSVLTREVFIRPKQLVAKYYDLNMDNCFD